MRYSRDPASFLRTHWVSAFLRSRLRVAIRFAGMTDIEHKHLGRLDSSFYRGRAYVHWTMTVQDRETGWLDFGFHASFREIQLHTVSKYRLACPVYVLMPDHMHILLIGMSSDSNQLSAIKFLRGHINRVLGTFTLQNPAFDHVLRENDRERNAFQKVVHYIRKNPVRARLCKNEEDYPYRGCMLTGYPELMIDDPDFWLRFWKICNRLTEQEGR